MINNFKSIKPFSPVENRDFIWVAEYADGTLFPEFDFQTKEFNNFYKIKKNELLRFGLVGVGLRLFFDVGTGIFDIVDNKIGILFKTDKQDYNLTGQNYLYNDIIQFKKSTTSFDLDIFDLSKQRRMPNGIFQYNFGYKANFNIEGINFGFKAICHVPYNAPIYFEFTIVSDKELDGNFIILNNNKEVFSDKALLQKNVGGHVEWLFRKN